MDASSVQHQEMHNQSLENVLVCSKTQQDRKPRPQPEQALKCPRCESTNTKFCYYNNYSLSQPRYFCKGCRRYWTQGGTLRNVPVGGGCRKNKRSSSSTKRIQDQPLTNPTGFQTLSYDSNDLSLAFARLQPKQAGGHLGYADHDISMLGNQNNAQSEVLGDVHTGNSSFLDALRSGFFHSQNGYHNMYNYGNINGEVENSGVSMGVSGEMVMPYEDMSTAATSNAVTMTTTKQETCNFPRENDNRILWGFPWQLSGDGNIGGDLASSWHGLVNTGPLM